MQPGDEVILPYEEYSQLKQALKANPGLVEQNKILKAANEELSHKLSITQQKLILKNGLLCKQQFKTEYLMSLFDDINTAFKIKAEDIGKGMKFLRNMDESYFSVIQLPGQVDQDERLPENFSKSDIYMEIDTELHAYKSLTEVCTKQWNQKNKLVQFLQGSIKPSQNKDIKKIDQQTQQKENKLKAEIQELKKQIQVQQNDNKRLQIQMKKVTLKSEKQKAESRQQIRQMQQEFIQIRMTSMQSQNQLKETAELKREKKDLQCQKKVLQQKFADIESQLLSMKQKHEKLEIMNKLEQTKQENLKNENIQLNAQMNELRRFANISAQKVDELKNQVQKLQGKIIELRKSSSASTASSNDHVTDIKSKLFSLISQYIIYLNKSLMEMSLTAADKKSIIKSEVLQVEEQFGKELRKLQF